VAKTSDLKGLRRPVKSATAAACQLMELDHAEYSASLAENFCGPATRNINVTMPARSRESEAKRVY
jgi:hypothetical protein